MVMRHEQLLDGREVFRRDRSHSVGGGGQGCRNAWLEDVEVMAELGAEDDL
jgi:hypothetical protein